MSPYNPIVDDDKRKQQDEDYLETARDRFKEASDADQEYRRLALEDLRFYDGDHWDPAIVTQRGPHRPCLTINRLPQFVHAVSNEIRQNKPSPKVSPIDDSGDVQTAEVVQGLIRHIEQQSNAASVRSYASFYSTLAGRSAYRIITEYAAPESFGPDGGDQEIFIRRIKNPLSVYMDPRCERSDFSDARYAFIVRDVSEDEYKARWPDADMSSLEQFRTIGDRTTLDWFADGGTRVAEYFSRETVPQQLALLPDGTVLPLDKVPQGVPIVQRKTVTIPVVHWCIMDGGQKLEEKVWPGRYIPIVIMIGEDYDIDGRTKYVGMVRNAKDAQRMLNYWESAKTEMIALAPKAPFIAAEGQLENHEDEWKNANTRSYAYLYYKPLSVGGQPVGPPQRQVYEPPVQAITAAESATIDHLKSTTGVYDPSLGATSNETSGIAIQRRLAQGSTANYHYIDNVAQAITYEAKVLIDLIPKIYDRPGRVVRIIGEDGAERRVTINQQYQDKGGMLHFYDLNAGRYDVAVDVGPSYATKRQESADSMLQFANAVPQLVPQYADLLVKAMDWPGAREISERLRPPGVPADDDVQIPPQAVQQIQQLSQQNQQLMQALQQAQQALDSQKLALDSNERIAAANNQTKESIAELQAQVDVLLKRADIGQKDRQITADHMGAMADRHTDAVVKSAEISSREDIATLNAHAKIAQENMKLKHLDIWSRDDIAKLNAASKLAAEEMKLERARQQPSQEGTE